MEIRKDFDSATTFLYRLAGIGEQFSRYDNTDWPQLKNREDFDKIYKLQDKERIQLEKLYSIGRDCAFFMGNRLREFNNVGQFPSLVEYVDSFIPTWVYKHEELHQFNESIKVLVDSLEQSPWSVQRMIEVFDDQLRLLTSVRQTLALLKQVSLYKIEKGDTLVEQEPAININQITAGKVVINSTDNSTNISIKSSPIFSELFQKIAQSEIEAEQKTKLLAHVEAMKQSEGNPGFVQKYKEFMQQAANHMTVISPFIPALTHLIR